MEWSILLSGIMLLGLYAWQVEPHLLRRRHASYKLRGGKQRLLLITDVHKGWGRSRLTYRRLLKDIARQHAEAPFDCVLLGGDYLDVSCRYEGQLREWLTKLVGLGVPVYAVLGDHDHDCGTITAAAIRSLVAGCSVRLLENEVARIGGYNLIGVRELMYDPGYAGLQGRRWRSSYRQETREYLKKCAWLPSLPQGGRQAIVLSHNPDAVYLPGIPENSLVLAGHTHGGQIWPLGLFADRFLITIPQGSWGSWAGRRRVQGKHLLVSRGVGCSLIPLRLGCRPEYWVIDLH